MKIWGGSSGEGPAEGLGFGVQGSGLGFRAKVFLGTITETEQKDEIELAEVEHSRFGFGCFWVFGEGWSVGVWVVPLRIGHTRFGQNIGHDPGSGPGDWSGMVANCVHKAVVV